MALCAEDLERIRQIISEERNALAREIAREVVSGQRRQEFAAYDVTLDFDQVAKIQRAKLRERQRAKRATKAAAKGV
ncbi:hypothetical protein [Geomonas propionica]|uniref:Uncharacterized protein n=1 Tax=Geomonas propionica TaxID=2798582 RepID=A0ABS0YL52_9BACT|nr:hypothetical protein [Geomonas propionica]MBJ6798625.1 hypothetical protein [Geomonas propionica]